MKNVLKIITILFITTVMFSCESEDDETTGSNALLAINVQATSSTEESITLEWEDLEEASWYFIEYGISGQSTEETGGYQDLNNEVITYELRGLEPGQEYELTLTGKDYLNGGSVTAVSETITFSTK